MAETFPNRIRELREARSWTVRELGERSGIAFNSIHKLETGATALDVDRMRRIAAAFGVKASALLNEDDVEFRVDPESQELLQEAMSLPVEQRGRIMRAAHEIASTVQAMAAAQSAAALRGDFGQVRELADMWNHFDDTDRSMALTLWKNARLAPTARR